MSKFKISYIFFIFTILFIILTSIYYQKTRETAIENAQIKIDEFLLNYKAFRAYVSKIQKEEVYRLQSENKLEENYFNPILLSSTFSARNVNNYYNIYKEQNNEKPTIIRFASDNPRNISNQANPKESQILKQFNENKIDKYIEIIENEDGVNLYYVLPTKRTTSECMKCHSDPKIAPKGMIEIYGDKNGFYEEEGKIRAILSTTYPLDEDLNIANEKFLNLTITTLIIFLISLYTVYKFTKKIELKNRELEALNKNLDDKVKERTIELEKEKQYIEAIYDTNPSIILVTNGKKLLDCNKKLLEFFDYESIEAFLNEHRCICEYFDLLDGQKLNEEYEINGLNWCKYLVQDQLETHLVSLIKDDETYYFNIGAIYLNKEKTEMLVSLQNITELKNKDHLLIQQSKMASIADMLNNIAHQWRQPLSVISTASTGVLLRKEFGNLDDKTLEENLNQINKTSQELSKTIDNFSEFFSNKQENTIIKIEDLWDNAIELFDSQYKDHTIEIVKNCEDIQLHNIKNDMLQIFISFLSNTKDAHSQCKTKNKYIFITALKNKTNIEIKIKDNAGGIDEKILPNIFEPYFTTKHKSMGTGLGLFMTYETVTTKLKGSIKVSNIEFEYNNAKYKGAEFIIKIPILNEEHH